jgi:hypothetical protein
MIGMHVPTALPAFVPAVLLISASPGPAMTLILPPHRPARHADGVLGDQGGRRGGAGLPGVPRLARVVAGAGAWFRRSTVRRRLEAVSGTVLVGLGLRVGLTSR